MKSVSALAAAAAVMFASWSAAAPAFAGDFNFTVPVEVANLPSGIDRGYVRCQLFIIGSSSSAVAGEARSSEFVVSGGAYRGTMRVEVTTNSAFSPAAVTDYLCSLWFRVTRSNGSASFYDAEHLAQGDPYPIEGRLTPLPGRASVAGGPIPR